MLYPGYMPLGIHESPNVLHYGVKFDVKQADPPIDWSYDKHWYQDFKPLTCPPWTRKDDAGQAAIPFHGWQPLFGGEGSPWYMAGYPALWPLWMHSKLWG